MFCWNPDLSSGYLRGKSKTSNLGTWKKATDGINSIRSPGCTTQQPGVTSPPDTSDVHSSKRSRPSSLSCCCTLQSHGSFESTKALAIPVSTRSTSGRETQALVSFKTLKRFHCVATVESQWSPCA